MLGGAGASSPESFTTIEALLEGTETWLHSVETEWKRQVEQVHAVIRSALPSRLDRLSLGRHALRLDARRGGAVFDELLRLLDAQGRAQVCQWLLGDTCSAPRLVSSSLRAEVSAPAFVLSPAFAPVHVDQEVTPVLSDEDFLTRLLGTVDDTPSVLPDILCGVYSSSLEGDRLLRAGLYDRTLFSESSLVRDWLDDLLDLWMTPGVLRSSTVTRLEKVVASALSEVAASRPERLPILVCFALLLLERLGGRGEPPSTLVRNRLVRILCELPSSSISAALLAWCGPLAPGHSPAFPSSTMPSGGPGASLERFAALHLGEILVSPRIRGLYPDVPLPWEDALDVQAAALRALLARLIELVETDAQLRNDSSGEAHDLKAIIGAAIRRRGHGTLTTEETSALLARLGSEEDLWTFVYEEILVEAPVLS